MSEREKLDSPQASTVRASWNRLLRLSSYAGGVVLLGISLLDWQSTKKDPTTFIILGIAALACFGIGYSNGQRRRYSQEKAITPTKGRVEKATQLERQLNGVDY